MRKTMDEFKLFLSEIEKLHVLPGSAIDMLPEDLGERTQKALLKRTPEEAAFIIMKGIRETERGSREPIDSLVWEKILHTPGDDN